MPPPQPQTLSYRVLRPSFTTPTTTTYALSTLSLRRFEPRITVGSSICRKHSRSSIPIPYLRKIHIRKRGRRQRAEGPQVSDTASRPMRNRTEDTNSYSDTAFRQQRLKAWQYVLPCLSVAFPKLTWPQQAHPYPKDCPPSLLHRRHHICAHRWPAAVCERTGAGALYRLHRMYIQCA